MSALSDTLDELNSDVNIVDFYADWCQPCKTLAPLLDDAFAEHGSRLNLIKVDADENLDACKEYGVQSLPTVLVVQRTDSGSYVEINRFTGSKPSAFLDAFIQDAVRAAGVANGAVT